MRARTATSALLVVAALVAGVLGPASADQTPADQQQQIHDRIAQTRNDLESASKQLQAAAVDLAKTQAELPGARAAYSSVVGRLATAKDRLALVRQQLRQLRAQQQKVKAEIAQAEKRIVTSQTVIARIVRYEYQTGGFGQLEVILQAETPTDFVQRLMASQSVTDSQTAAIQQLTADQAVLSAQQQQMQVNEEAIRVAEQSAADQVSNLQSLALKAKQAKAHIKSLIQARAAALAVARGQRAAEQKRLANLKSAQEQLANQIAAQTSTGSGSPSGSLLWPIPGASVTQGVGWRTHPVYGYPSCHTGIDLGASTGTPIEAARAGTVVWTHADLSGPYGNNTLIDHGNGLSTFYAHQSAFNVSPGQHVQAGQVIGLVGETGYATGPHLHFEVHVNGVPYDPMGWFGGTKTPQSVFCP